MAAISKSNAKGANESKKTVDSSNENHFCIICNNLLISMEGSTLKLVCVSCGQQYDATAEDTLIYEEVKGVNLMIYSKIIRKIKYDPVSPKAYSKCNKCKHNVVRQARLGDQLKLINACLKCDNVWVAN